MQPWQQIIFKRTYNNKNIMSKDTFFLNGNKIVVVNAIEMQKINFKWLEYIGIDRQ